MLVSWDEAQATKDNRLSGTAWNATYGKIGGAVPPADDANGQFESTTLFWQSELSELPKWKSWDLTALTQKWLNSPTSNYGVILWATNEDVAGYTMRFHSSEASNSSDRPYLEVVYSTEATTRTVYFLKDHLGSIRATVLDSAGAPVIGYDDYDPWGYPLALRTKAIPTAYLQGASKNKFTGNEFDDDFGLNWGYHIDRFYDHQIGRWWVVDPIDQYSLSPYVYAANNPLRFIDPFGADTMYVDWPNGKRTAHYIPDIYAKDKSDEGIVKPRPGMLFGLAFIATGEVVGINDIIRVREGLDPFSGQRISGVERGMSAGAMLSMLPGGLKPLIKITSKGLTHVIERHTINAISKFAKKSKFFKNVNIPGLVQKANQVDPIPQANGRLAWIVDAGTNIGIDRTTGQATRIYTVITEGTGELVTAYPGLP
jgi:RHS repeat-associated protein